MEDRHRNLEYIPVACDVVDHIEIFATTRQKVSIVLGGFENQIRFKGVIKTWYTKDKVEYLQLVGGCFVRLDKLVEIGGISANGRTCIV